MQDSDYIAPLTKDCVVFVARSPKKGNRSKSIYAFLYDDGTICIGPTTYSSAGEYRTYLTTMKAIASVADSPILLDAMRSVAKFMSMSLLGKTAEERPPHTGFMYMAICWLKYQLFLLGNSSTVTIFKDFDELFKHQDGFTKIVKKHGRTEIEKLLFTALDGFQFAQKVMPVPVKALTYNLNYQAWREIHIGGLKIPGTAEMISWFWLEAAGKFLYDTAQLKNKFKKSEEIGHVIDSLAAIRSRLHNVDSQLENMLGQPISYARDGLIMSDSSIVMIFKHRGTSLVNLTQKITIDVKQITKCLLALNEKGIIHSDLHIGNIVYDESFWIIDFGEAIFYPQDLDAILSLIKYRFPTLYESNAGVLSRIRHTNPEKLFALWTAIDWYLLSKDLLEANLVINQKEIADINKAAWQHLTEIESVDHSFNEDVIKLSP